MNRAAGRAAVLLAAAALASCAALNGRPPEAPSRYRNPVQDREFADPAVLRAPDGSFYAYGTQAGAGSGMLNIQVARSQNLVRWDHLGDALPQKATWASAKQHYWAPHVAYDGNLRRYFMYYSAEPDAVSGKCLGVATADAPAGPFVDSGRPLLCGEGIEHIDPMAFDDPQTGARLLFWGSGSLPIRAQELSPGRTSFLPGSVATEVLRPDRAAPYGALVEAAWMTYRDGWYFLYYSGDRCCAPDPRYAVMVARSRSALGPFEAHAGPILQRNEVWLAPGHCSIATDDAGDDWIVYHAINAEAADRSKQAGGEGRTRVMLLDRITYRDGWPYIAGSAPSVAPQKAPLLTR